LGYFLSFSNRYSDVFVLVVSKKFKAEKKLLQAAMKLLLELFKGEK